MSLKTKLISRHNSSSKLHQSNSGNAFSSVCGRSKLGLPRVTPGLVPRSMARATNLRSSWKRGETWQRAPDMAQKTTTAEARTWGHCQSWEASKGLLLVWSHFSARAQTISFLPPLPFRYTYLHLLFPGIFQMGL